MKKIYLNVRVDSLKPVIHGKLQRLRYVVHLESYCLIKPALEFFSTYLIESVTAIRHGDITVFHSVQQCIVVTIVVAMLGWITVMRGRMQKSR